MPRFPRAPRRGPPRAWPVLGRDAAPRRSRIPAEMLAGFDARRPASSPLSSATPRSPGCPWSPACTRGSCRGASRHPRFVPPPRGRGGGSATAAYSPPPPGPQRRRLEAIRPAWPGCAAPADRRDALAARLARLSSGHFLSPHLLVGFPDRCRHPVSGRASCHMRRGHRRWRANPHTTKNYPGQARHPPDEEPPPNRPRAPTCTGPTCCVDRGHRDSGRGPAGSTPAQPPDPARDPVIAPSW